MSPKDKDALIKRVEHEIKYLEAHAEYDFAADLWAMISLISPSPAQTETDEEDDFPDLPKCKHGVGIFGDRIKCEECDAESGEPKGADPT